MGNMMLTPTETIGLIRDGTDMGNMMLNVQRNHRAY